jgi:predicted enzyme related to lactoylglutathione lyase
MPNATPHFVWYEAALPDAEAGRAFYSDVVGWSSSNAGAPDRPYHVFTAGASPIGGLMPLSDEMRAMGVPPCWTGYVGVPDVDAYAARVVDAGGSVRRPPDDIPGIGRFAVVADPHGAAFILFHGTGDMGPRPEPGAPGTVGWNELMAGDLDSAWAFYQAVFGWTPDQAVPMGELGTYQTFFTGGPFAEGGMMTTFPKEQGTYWKFYFNVPALDAAIARLTAGGGKVVHGPMQVPGGRWMVQALDPQGALFALLSQTR